MANETLARRYAAAIFSLAEEQHAVERVGTDIHTIDDAISSDENTKRFFLAPIIDRKDKERVMISAFNGKIDPISLQAMLLLIRKRRERLLSEIVEQYDKLEIAARGSEPMIVTTARELPADELRSMVRRLERLYQRKYDVTQRVDSNLIAGVRVTIGDRRIDASIAGRLDQLARDLFAKN